MLLRDEAKVNVARRLPWVFRGRPPARVSWAEILIAVSLWELVTAAYKALALVGLVWLVHRCWLSGLPTLGYLPAVGIILLARLAWPLSRPEPGGPRPVGTGPDAAG